MDCGGSWVPPRRRGVKEDGRGHAAGPPPSRRSMPGSIRAGVSSTGPTCARCVRGGGEPYRANLRGPGPRAMPIFEALRHVPGRLVTRARRDVISDAAWYGSVAWNEYRRPMKLDDQLTSVYRIPGNGTISVIA